MKIKYRYIFFIFIFQFLIIVSSITFSQNTLSIPNKINFQSHSTSLKIIENNNQTLHLRNDISLINYLSIIATQGQFTQLFIDNYSPSLNNGFPQLPVLRKLIEVPEGTEVQIEILNYNIQEYHLNEFGITTPLFPVQPSRSKSNERKDTLFHYNKVVYSQNLFISALTNDSNIISGIVSTKMLGKLRYQNLARLDIAPIQYNPVSNTIRVYHDLEFKLNFVRVNKNNTSSSKGNTNNIFNTPNQIDILNNIKSNTKGNKIFSQSPIKYVIVADSMFRKTLQPFIKWKIKKGFNVIEVYTSDPMVGKTTNSIRNYLKNIYDAATPSDPAPTYLLLVGDVSQIPSFSGRSVDGSHYTDLYYGEYNGDYLPEVFYGRFPANTISQLQTMIEKTIQYETYAMPDPSYLSKTLLIAGVDRDNGSLMNAQLDYEASNYFNSAHGFQTTTFNYPFSGTKDSAIIAQFNTGYNFVNYTGHGQLTGFIDPSFRTSDIPALTNYNKYPWIISNACRTNIFNAVEDGFGEAIVKAKNRGALAFIGASDDTYWTEDYYWSVGFKNLITPVYSSSTTGAIDRLFHDHGESVDDWAMTLGQIVQSGNISVMKSGSSSYDLYWEIYHIMGDPSIMPYLGIPSKLNVQYNTLLPIGAASFPVKTEPYAYVAISRNDTLYGAASIDSTGIIDLPIIPFTKNGWATIVITKQNRQPYIDSIYVEIPQNPYITYKGNSIDDAEGNNNGLIEQNEKIKIKVLLKNIGLIADSNVTAKIISSDTNITLLNDSGYWNIIQPDQTLLQQNTFVFKTKLKLQDQHSVDLDLQIKGTNNISFTSSFSLILNAPVLEINQILIDDSIGGNNNHRLDPGETINLKIINSNNGHADAFPFDCNITSDYKDLIFNNNTFHKDSLKKDSSIISNYSLSVNYTAEKGSVIPITYTLNSGSFTLTKKIFLPVGQLIEDFEHYKSPLISWDTINLHPWEIIDTAISFMGTHCAISAKIKNNENSVLSTKYKVLYNDTISFYRKVSSELNFDFLEFFIDEKMVCQWSGELNWSKVSFPVSAGNHTFKWIYVKDMDSSVGYDRAWIDEIIFPPVVQNDVSVNDHPLSNTDQNEIKLFPIPASNQLNINYNLPTNQTVDIYMYDMIGHLVKTINKNLTTLKGEHTETIDINELENGFYFLIFKTPTQTTTKKFIVAK